MLKKRFGVQFSGTGNTWAELTIS